MRDGGKILPHRLGGHVVLQPELGLTMYYSMHVLNYDKRLIRPKLRNVMYACLEY